MNAEIITIGDELLIGQIVDTNSAWMAKILNDYGINISQITSIPDDIGVIIKTLHEAAERVRLVLITGGLGPTRDDKTKNAICQFFGTNLVMNEDVLKNIEIILSPRGVSMNELNRGQAMVPASATVLQNIKGTAPGLMMEKGGCHYFFLPGVPFEMKYLMEEEVLPILRKKFSTTQIFHKTVLTQGLPESILAEKISDWEDHLPEFIKLAYLPSPLSVRLRLSARGLEINMMKRVVAEQIEILKTIIPYNIYGYDEDTLAGNIGELLMSKGLTISTAESCTGGEIATMITVNPGSSKYYKGSVVAYSNEVKLTILHVKESSLNMYGAVSQQVVEEMAIGIKQLLSTDYSIATSGITGPNGGSNEKPVGMVWIAIASPTGVISQTFNFGSDRERNIIRSSQTALNLLRKSIVKDIEN